MFSNFRRRTTFCLLLANSILEDKALATLVVKKAAAQTITMLSPRKRDLAMAVLTRRKAESLHLENHPQSPRSMTFWSYLRPSLLAPTAEDLAAQTPALMLCLGRDQTDLLLLCAENGIGFPLASKLLNESLPDLQSRFDASVLNLRFLLGTPDDSGETLMASPQEALDCVHEMRKELTDYMVIGASPLPFILNGQNRRRLLPKDFWREWSLAVFAFLILDMAAIFVFANILDDSIVRIKSIAYGKAAQSTVKGTGVDTLNNLFYEISDVPDDFWLTSHFFSPYYAVISYMGPDSGSISFSQQVSRSPITGLDCSKAGRILFHIKGNPAVFMREDGLGSLLWYDRSYAYSLTTSFGHPETSVMAETTRMTTGGHYAPDKNILPLQKLPIDYSPRLALESGDIIIGSLNAGNLDRVKGFYNNYERLIGDYLRMSIFDENGNSSTTDLITFDGRLYCIQSSLSAPKNGYRLEQGQEYSKLSIVYHDNGCTLLLSGENKSMSLIVA